MNCLTRLLTPLVLLCCIAGTASADAFFLISLQSQRDDGVHVTVYEQILSSLPACVPPRPYCVLWDSQILVSPCPPGKPCVNDVYEVHPALGEWPLELVLDYGMTYQFTGNIERKYAPNVSGLCGTYSCVSQEPIAPASYVTPTRNERSHWAVTFAGANEDTVWVDAQIESDNLAYVPCTLNPNCHYYNILMTVNGDTYLELPLIDLPATFRIALLPHQLYMFDGHFSHVTGNHSCEVPDCAYYEDFEGTAYDTGAVAVRPTTWGKVKSLYREP